MSWPTIAYDRVLYRFCIPHMLSSLRLKIQVPDDTLHKLNRNRRLQVLPLRQMEIYRASLSFRLCGLKYTLKRCINATILTHTKNREYKHRNCQGKVPISTVDAGAAGKTVDIGPRQSPSP